MSSPKTSSRVRSPWGTTRQPALPGPDMDVLLGEQGVEILEGLELQRIARRVEEEHGGLLARFALEAHIGFDHEPGAGVLQLLGQRFPDGHLEDRAKMAYRHIVIIDTAGLRAAAFGR